MEARGGYDSSLQMFIEAPRSVDMSRLTFLRWLADNGKLEHQPSGPPSGELAVLAPRVARAEVMKDIGNVRIGQPRNGRQGPEYTGRG